MADNCSENVSSTGRINISSSTTDKSAPFPQPLSVRPPNLSTPVSNTFPPSEKTPAELTPASDRQIVSGDEWYDPFEYDAEAMEDLTPNFAFSPYLDQLPPDHPLIKAWLQQFHTEFHNLIGVQAKEVIAGCPSVLPQLDEGLPPIPIFVVYLRERDNR